MSTPQLSIITVAYNSAAPIAALAESLKKHPPHIPWEWIVVENFSTPTATQQLKSVLKNTPNTHLICLEKNTGFGTANAEGLRFAQGQYLALINPDITLTPTSFPDLITTVAQASHPTIAAPILSTTDGTLLPNARKFPEIFGLLRRRICGHTPPKPPQQPTAIDWAQGSFWVLKKTTFETLSGFDPRFFLFFEDTDLCRRLNQQGGRVLHVPTAHAHHSPHRLSGGPILKALFRKTFWIHLYSAIQYFWKWRTQ